MSVLRFQDEVHHKPLDVSRAALSFAQEIAYPRLDVEHYLDELDNLTRAARAAVPNHSPIVERAISLGEFLFVKEGFQGNQADYWDPRNSFLNDVLDRRLGIPISLSAVYLHVGLRLGLPVGGVGLPGHFIVCVRGDHKTTYLDPFHDGKVLSAADCSLLVQKATGFDGRFQKEWLRKSQPSEMITRMLNNLRGIYIHKEEWPKAVSVVERLRILWPKSPDYQRDLGLLLYRQGSLRRSVDTLSTYLRQNPDAPDAAEIKNCMRHICKELAILN
ncbi:MAG: tetratricopeptide repeat protein [Anaerolineales bacterium]|nr:tetratricopeptide repeat protein [Anaerolineales bacterium]